MLTATYNANIITIISEEGTALYTITLCATEAQVAVPGQRGKGILTGANLTGACRWQYNAATDCGRWMLVMGQHILPLPGGVLDALRGALAA